jgi:hypothetical protein
MKDEPVPLAAKSPKERFYELGHKIMTVPKDVIDARDKAWKNTRRRRKRKSRVSHGQT